MATLSMDPPLTAVYGIVKVHHRSEWFIPDFDVVTLDPEWFIPDLCVAMVQHGDPGMVHSRYQVSHVVVSMALEWLILGMGSAMWLSS